MHCSARWGSSPGRSGSDMRDDSWLAKALVALGVAALIALVATPVLGILWSIGFGQVWR